MALTSFISLSLCQGIEYPPIFPVFVIHPFSYLIKLKFVTLFEFGFWVIIQTLNLLIFPFLSLTIFYAHVKGPVCLD
jgi:hypothetical protein